MHSKEAVDRADQRRWKRAYVVLWAGEALSAVIAMPVGLLFALSSPGSTHTLLRIATIGLLGASLLAGLVDLVVARRLHRRRIVPPSRRPARPDQAYLQVLRAWSRSCAKVADAASSDDP